MRRLVGRILGRSRGFYRRGSGRGEFGNLGWIMRVCGRELNDMFCKGCMIVV